MVADWDTTFLGIAYGELPVSIKEKEAAQKLHREFLQLVQTVDAQQPWL